MSQQTKTELHRQFASRLKAIRLRQGMSQAALADFLNIPASRIGNWESGRNGPNPSSLGDIAKKLSVSVEFLSGRDEAIPQSSGSPSAEEFAGNYSVRSARLLTRLSELTDIEYARVEAALMGVVDAVLSSRPLAAVISPAPQSADHAVEMAALDVGRTAVQVVRSRSGSPSTIDKESSPTGSAAQGPIPPAAGSVSDQKTNRHR